MTTFAPAIYRAPVRRQQSITVSGLTPSPTNLFPALPGTYAITGTDATIVSTRVLSCNPGSYAITGTSATIVAQRALSADPGSYAITGANATVGRELSFNAGSGSYAITGADAGLGQTAAPPTASVYKAIKAHTPKTRAQVSQMVSGLPLLATEYTLDAQPGLWNITYFDAGVVASTRAVDAQPASYTLTGVLATLEFTGIAAAPNVVMQAVKAHTPKKRKLVSQAISALAPSTPVGGYDLDAQPGAFVITGFEAVTLYDIPGAAQAVVVRAVKQAATPKPRRRVSITFQQFTPVPELALNAAPGTFAITALDANTTHDVPTNWDRIIVPNYAHQKYQIYYGSRQFYGVEIEGVREITATQGGLTLTGFAVTFLWTHQFFAAVNAYAITGSAATLTYTPLAALSLNAEPGSYAIIGSEPTLAATRLFTASPASYAVAGFDIDTQLSKDLNALPGSYTVSGVAVTFVGIWVLLASPGSYVLTGRQARLAANDLSLSDHQPTNLTLTDHSPSTLTLTDI